MIRPLNPLFLRAAVVCTAFLGALGNLRAQIPAAPTPPATSVDEMRAEAGAEAAAATWLQLRDTGKYAETWQTASDLFHQAITQDGWVTLLKGGVPVFGDVVSRKLKAAAFTRILPGAPDGQYVVVQYQTVFTNMKDATEQMALALEANGTWKVCGYHIK
jgi:hypothetical protein